jgi:hypothetical protein
MSAVRSLTGEKRTRFERLNSVAIDPQRTFVRFRNFLPEALLTPSDADLNRYDASD